MTFRSFATILFFLCACATRADDVQRVVGQAMDGLEIAVSPSK